MHLHPTNNGCMLFRGRKRDRPFTAFSYNLGETAHQYQYVCCDTRNGRSF